MHIGIDGSRAFVEQKTGTEFYSYHMLRAISQLKTKHQYTVYVAKGQRSKLVLTDWPDNFRFVEIRLSRLWTQIGLAARTWGDAIDLLWVPAHTLPILGNPALPMVVTIHGIEYEHLPGAYKWGQNLHLTWSTHWALMRAKFIVTVSEKTKKDVIEKMGTNESKINVIHEGVDLGKFVPLEKKLRQKELVINEQKITNPFMLFVGTVQPRKNLIRLIQAFAKLKKETHKNMELVIVGKLGWDYQQIVASPKKYKVESCVHFLKYVSDSDLCKLYKNASLYIEPSLQEGFGLPVLEAMASGVPVVAARAGALPEVVGDAGVLVDPLSVSSIKQGMIEALQHSSELVKKGFRRCKQFRWDTAAQNLINVFEKATTS